MQGVQWLPQRSVMRGLERAGPMVSCGTRPIAVHDLPRPIMNHEVWLWVALAAYGIHVLEEFVFDSIAITAIVLGAALMACPIIMLKLKDKPFFKQG
jgi:hypothetical protein